MATFRNLNILQNNINSIRPAANRSLLIHFLQSHKIDIAFLSEIWLKPTEDFNFPGYNFPKQTRDKGYGGVGLLIKKEINFKILKLPDIQPIEAIAIKTLNTSIPYLLISIYIPPNPINNNQIKHPIELLLNFIDTQNISTVLAGDFNAHHPIWNNANKICSRGELLADLIENRNLIAINDGSPTMIRPPNTTPSAIDITFVSSDVAPNTNWEVLDEEICGDHKIIIFQIINAAKQYNYQTVLVNNKKVIENLNAINPNDINTPKDLITVFEHNITKAKYKPNKKFHPKKWWTPEIQKLLEDKNKKLAEYCNNLTLEHFLAFKKARTILKSKIRKEKRKSFNQLTDLLTPDLNSKQLWTTVKLISGGFSKKNNLILLNDSNLSSQFMDTNFPNITNQINYNMQSTVNKLTINFNDFLNFIRSKKNTSAPGPDNVSYLILKQLNLKLIQQISLICNNVLGSEIIPPEWLTIKCVPILKPGKPENLPDSYRPICLISTFLKIINNKVKKELVKHTKLNNILPKYSFGFREKTSSVNCVNTLITTINNSKNNKKIVLVTFLDLSKAFDNVNITKLLNILTAYNYPPELVNWLFLYLKQRNIILTLNDGSTIQRQTNKGLPQGCPLSPILFNIYTSKIHETEIEGFLIQFADDFALVTEGENFATASNKMNTSLNLIYTEFESLGMQVNPNKSATICFANNAPDNLNIHINNNPIEIKIVHKYLGIWIDQKLNFKTHITETVNKAKKKINILKMLSRKKGGCHPNTLQKINNSIIRSLFDYGISIYSSACKTDFNRIEKVQNLSIRTSLRYLQSTPIHVIYAESGELPLKYRAQYLTFKEILKTIYYNISPVSTKLSELINSDYLPKFASYLEKIASINNFHLLQCRTLNVESIELNKLNKLVIIPIIPNLNKNKTPLAIQKMLVQNLIREDYSTHYQLFTDGSKTKQGVGYGFYDVEQKTSYSYKLNSTFSIMNAEIVAIIEAIEYAITINRTKIVILTDSQSSCIKLLNNSTDNYLIQKLFTLIYYNNFEEIAIQWIPGHINLNGNDRADTAAKLGITKHNQENYALTLGDCLLNFKLELINEWNQEYTELSTEKGILHFKIMEEIELKPWFHNMHLSTTETLIINRIRTYHTATKDRLAKWNLIRSDMCTTCNTQENLHHILFECIRLSGIRNKFPVLYQKNDLQLLLKNKKQNEYLQIAHFLIEAKINV